MGWVMSQTKKDSHIETLTNQIVGIIIGFSMVYFLFPLFDYLDQFWVATISTCLFFVSSYARSYSLRRFFNSNYWRKLKGLFDE